MPGEKEAVASTNAIAILARLRLWPGSNVVIVDGKHVLREAVLSYASKFGIEGLNFHNEWCSSKRRAWKHVRRFAKSFV